MPGLLSLHGLLQAPRLRELELVKKVKINASDVDEIVKHPTLKNFGWFAENVPDKVWLPVVKKIGLPPAPPVTPERWFGLPTET